MRAVRGRVAAGAALVGALLALVAVIVGVGGGPYVVHARFADAGQVLPGNLVQVGGRRIGEIRSIGLSRDGQADVVLVLDRRPLRVGTRATIRTLGLSGVANRFIELVPGPPSGAPIPDGGVIDASHTQGVVDLDMLLDSFDPRTRRDVRTIIRSAARAVTPSAARQLNSGLAYLNPAVSTLTALGRELTLDQAALRSLLARTASVASTLAAHRASLGSGIDATSRVLAAVASERGALGAMLRRAPGAFAATTRTLRRLRSRTLPAVDPWLRALRPAAGPADRLLRATVPTLRDARPLVSRLRALVPEARAALEPLPELERAATPAIASAVKAIGESMPVVSGLRPYGPDLVAGLFSGFGGSTSGSYDANGHYARIQLVAGEGALPGLLPKPPGGSLGGYRTGLDARCPGAAEEPAADRSNPWDAGAGAACDPKDDHK